MENIISGIRDNNLKLMLAFGIGIHHAGLVERDRKTVEELFVNQRIQVICFTDNLNIFFLSVAVKLYIHLLLKH